MTADPKQPTKIKKWSFLFAILGKLYETIFGTFTFFSFTGVSYRILKKVQSPSIGRYITKEHKINKPNNTYSKRKVHYETLVVCGEDL
jgi:hypothetical protein